MLPSDPLRLRAKGSHWHILQAKFVQRVVSSRMPAL
jgi:hypothetical protein